MRTIKYFVISLLLMPLLVSAQTPLTLPSPGIVPDSAFYFLDRVGEALQEFFTFNSEAKARLQLEFAAERIAEIKLLLETKGVAAKGLDVAEERLKAHFVRTTDILQGEKDKGRDVSSLAKDLSEGADSGAAALRETFKAEKRALDARKQELKARISDARKAGDAVLVETLTEELDALKTEKDLLDEKEGKQHDALGVESEKISHQLEKKDDADHTIREAEFARQEFLDEAAYLGIVVPEEVLAKFDKLLAQAQELFVKENYEGAKELAKAADKSLERAGDAIDSLSEAKEREDELREEKENKENEIEQKEAERIREESKQENERAREESKQSYEIEREAAKQEAELLEHDLERASEEAKHAEELLREAGRNGESD